MCVRGWEKGREERELHTYKGLREKRRSEKHQSPAITCNRVQDAKHWCLLSATMGSSWDVYTHEILW